MSTIKKRISRIIHVVCITRKRVVSSEYSVTKTYDLILSYMVLILSYMVLILSYMVLV